MLNYLFNNKYGKTFQSLNTFVYALKYVLDKLYVFKFAVTRSKEFKHKYKKICIILYWDTLAQKCLFKSSRPTEG